MKHLSLELNLEPNHTVPAVGLGCIQAGMDRKEISAGSGTVTQTSMDIWLLQCQQRYLLDVGIRALMVLESVLGIYITNLSNCSFHPSSCWLEES